VAFSPDSQRILTAGDDGIVRVWDAATGAQLHDLLSGANRALCAMYSPDGQRIASGGFDDNVRIWNAQTFEQVRSWAATRSMFIRWLGGRTANNFYPVRATTLFASGIRSR